MSRRSLLVVISVLGHALVLALIVVASVLATGVIPTPFDRVTFAMERPIKIMDVHLPSIRPPVRHVAETQLLPSVQIAAPEAASPIAAPAQIASAAVTSDDDATSNDGVAVPILVDGGSLPGTGFDTPIAPAAPSVATPVHVSLGIRMPRKVANVDPIYPASARAARVEGIVIIEATIDAEGRVQAATVLRSIPLLDRAALDAVRQWRYTPTILNGSPVSVIMNVTVNFSLAAR